MPQKPGDEVDVRGQLLRQFPGCRHKLKIANRLAGRGMDEFCRHDNFETVFVLLVDRSVNQKSCRASWQRLRQSRLIDQALLHEIQFLQ